MGNRYQPHVLVLPEDDVNSQLANGFLMDVDWMRQRQARVLPVAGGWQPVLDLFKSSHIAEMYNYSQRFMVLLIDFDGQPDSLNTVKAAIPEDLADRVFILGFLTQPEDLKKAKDLKKANLDSYEKIGFALAKACREGNDNTWDHDLLKHNKNELDRLREHVRPILF